MKSFLTSVSSSISATAPPPLAFQSSLSRRKRIQSSPSRHHYSDGNLSSPFNKNNNNNRVRPRWVLSALEVAPTDETFDNEDDGGGDGEDDEFLLLENMLQDVKLDDSELKEFLRENDEMLSIDGFADDVNTLFELMDHDEDDDDEEENMRDGDNFKKIPPTLDSSELEKALLQGVVPVAAGVGSECLPGDWGFDPLGFASKDYILDIQYKLLQSLPGAEQTPAPKDRPTALILRDYREAEIRHGRLAMLAAVFWPLQEMLDRLLLDDDQFGPIVYDTVTLPYFPLLMTLFMLNLGYLDIFAKEMQEKDNIGDAYLPGDCLWDPLKFLEGAPPRMKRNMQERELFNGRVAMLAVAAYFFEEVTSGVPIVSMDANQLLFIPAYEIPSIQEWLDLQFSPSFDHYEF
ncbi:unnamed protein product [Cylindrotheca closterium]|uniref:Uncharacterized protein n=1 Tax=Cylindrotheca closterium TaxID=2856 RepID=A0AAD2JL36_9STRA|nr:unnamed protein product [Cylindrotheca closterium]